MLSCRLIKAENGGSSLPLYLYCIGCHDQVFLTRPEGFPAHQVFMTRRGKGIFRIFDYQDCQLSPGSVLVVPQGVAHEYFPVEGPWELGYVCFMGPLAEALLQRLGIRCNQSFVLKRFSEMWQQFEELWYNSDNSDLHAAIASSAKLYAFLLYLSENQLILNAETPETAGCKDPIKEIARIINGRYDEPLALAEIARLIGYSPQHIGRLFRKRYGISPHQYLERIRMQQALNQLHEHPELQIHEISERVGLETSYFIRLFKKTFKITPKQYRSNPFLLETSLFDFFKNDIRH